jgi:hypothetical protein
VRRTRRPVRGWCAWRPTDGVWTARSERLSALPHPHFEGTTILSVRRAGRMVMGGDGQASFGNTVMKVRHEITPKNILMIGPTGVQDRDRTPAREARRGALH